MGVLDDLQKEIQANTPKPAAGEQPIPQDPSSVINEGPISQLDQEIQAQGFGPRTGVRSIEPTLREGSPISLLEKEIGQQPVVPQEPGLGQTFTTGLKRGILQTTALGKSFGGTLASIFAPALETGPQLIEEARLAQQEADRLYPRSVQRVEDIDSLGKFIRWGADTAGEQTSVLASVVASGGLAALGTHLATRGIGKAAIRSALTKFAGTAGAFSGATALETGSTALDQAERIAAGSTEANTPGLNLLAGAAKGSLEIITPVTIARRLGLGLSAPLANQLEKMIFGSFIRRGLPVRIAAGALGVAGAEATTEAMQEAIDVAVERFKTQNYGKLSDADISRLTNAGAAGGFLGLLFGGVGGVSHRAPAGSERPATEAQIQATLATDTGDVASPPQPVDVVEPDTTLQNIDDDGGRVGAITGLTADQGPEPLDPDAFNGVVDFLPPEPTTGQPTVPEPPVPPTTEPSPIAPVSPPTPGPTPAPAPTTTTTAPNELDIPQGSYVLLHPQGSNIASTIVNEDGARLLAKPPNKYRGWEMSFDEYDQFMGEPMMQAVTSKDLGEGFQFSAISDRAIPASNLSYGANVIRELAQHDIDRFLLNVAREDKQHARRLVEEIKNKNTLPGARRFAAEQLVEMGFIVPLSHQGDPNQISPLNTSRPDLIVRNLYNVTQDYPAVTTGPRPGKRRNRVAPNDSSFSANSLKGQFVGYVLNPKPGSKRGAPRLADDITQDPSKLRSRVTLAITPGMQNDARVQDVGQRLLNLARIVLPKMLPNQKIILNLKNDNSLSFYGSNISFDNNVGVITVNLALAREERDMLTAFSHEMGHAIAAYELRNAPARVTDAIQQAYNLYLDKARGAPYTDWAKSFHAPDISMLQALETGDALGRGNPVSGFRTDNVDYWYGFDEWFAEQTAKWFVTNKKPIGTVEKFFQGIAEKIKTLFKTFGLITQDYKATDAMEDYLDSLFDRKFSGQPSLVKESFAYAQQIRARRNLPETAPTELVNRVAEELKIPFPLQARQGMDRYNRFIRNFWNILQIGDKNKHVPGMNKYIGRLYRWNIEKMNIISRGDTVVKQWSRLGADMSNRLSRFIFDIDAGVYLRPGENARHPTQQELTDLALQHGLSQEALNVFEAQRKDFRDILEKMRDALIQDVMSTVTDPVQRGERLVEINTEFDGLANRPYFPHARFGDYTITVKDSRGNTIRVEFTETRARQISRSRELARQFPNAVVGLDRIPKEFTPYKGLPANVLKRILPQLNLTGKQLAQFEDLILALAPANSFKHHFAKRDNTAGFSMDAMRAYANYMFHAGNHIARILHGPALRDAIGEVEDSANAIRNAGGDATTRRQIADYLNEHFDYIMNPENEWSGLRSLAFQWWLGFSPMSALVNLTQNPMVTLPYLSARFGDLKALSALQRAASDVKGIYLGKYNHLTPELQNAITEATTQGFIDESQATELAGVSEGSNLQRFMPSTAVGRGIKHLGFWSGWMFQHAEKINRRVAFRAGWDLAQKADFDNKYLRELRTVHEELYDDLLLKGWSPKNATAFLAARDTVIRTQFEYASFARPRFMRGKKSALFTFFMFKQNMLWFFKNSPGGGRALLMLAFMGGLMGIPGFEDADAIIKFISRKLFGKNFSLEEESRKLATELTDKPDLLLHGISRYSFGFPQAAQAVGIPFPTVDFSASLSQGEIVPGIGELSSLLTGTSDFETGVTRTGQQVAGAAFGIPINIVKALTDDNPDVFKRWERAMPRALRNAVRGMRFGARGYESNRAGAKIVTFDTADPEQMAEVIAQTLGFTPARLSQTWEMIRFQQETEKFYQVRRAEILGQADLAFRMKNREGMADVRQAVKTFNSEVPFPEMRISGPEIGRSLKTRYRGRVLTEHGIAPERRHIRLRRSTGELFPEVIEKKNVR